MGYPPGGTRLLNWIGGCRWGGGGGGSKPDPVIMRSAHEKYTLSQYTLLKNIQMHTYPVAILHTSDIPCLIGGAELTSKKKKKKKKGVLGVLASAWNAGLS